MRRTVEITPDASFTLYDLNNVGIKGHYLKWKCSHQDLHEAAMSQLNGCFTILCHRNVPLQQNQWQKIVGYLPNVNSSLCFTIAPCTSLSHDVNEV